jgi:HAD superfamily hydrolase (TIGR01509 family)
LNPGKIENIVFDLGNTLCYFDFCYFFDGVARLEKKLNPREFRKYIFSNRLDIKLSTSRVNHKEFFKRLKRKFNLKIGYSDFTYMYKDIFWENTPMKNFLEQISSLRKFKLFLVSNTCPVHINFLNKNFPYINLIKNKIYSFRVKMMKPDKKIFRYFIKKFKINPEKSIFVDDLSENIKIASLFGFKTIHYTTHKSFIKQFNKLIR